MLNEDNLHEIEKQRSEKLKMLTIGKKTIADFKLKTFFSVSTFNCPFCHSVGYFQTTLHNVFQVVQCFGCDREMVVELNLKPEIKIYY